ncbi:MAG TPA: DUF1361 domain-containing protein [Candidatus Dormibacteraeota bacterium]|nr:DUF1361 domain-containing protein [Candidatus Dormibacteraeota bacterium]
MKSRFIEPKYYSIIISLFIALAICLVMILINAITAKSVYYFYLPYNVFLAFISPIFAIILKNKLKTQPWLKPTNLLLTFFLLIFLPNSFYMITDLIHVQYIIGIDVLYNIIFTNLAIFIGLVAGFSSLYIFHTEVLKRMYYKYAHLIIGVLVVFISFAIYLGRYLRWNSWDIVLNPSGILFDTSDTLIHPSIHPSFFPIMFAFSFTIGAMYLVIWQFIKYFKNK